MNYQKDVSNFMILGEQKIASDLNLKNEQTQLYMNLIKEEFEETAKAFEEEDLVEVADGLADMVWVIMGMCNSVGIDFDKIWEEVKSSNMSKFVDGKFIKNVESTKHFGFFCARNFFCESVTRPLKNKNDQN